jgi:hypothetical protein
VLKDALSREARKDIRTRQHLSERSFAQSTRYGFKRARWRRLWRMEIQDFLIAAVQNIRILIDYSERRAQSNVIALFGHVRPLVMEQRLALYPISFLKVIKRNIKSFFNCLFPIYRLEPAFSHLLL